MLERWYPTAHVPSVFAIDYEKLPRWATKAFCLTLTTRLSTTATIPRPRWDALFRHIHSLGLKTLLLSDNSAARIERFNRNTARFLLPRRASPTPLPTAGPAPCWACRRAGRLRRRPAVPGYLRREPRRLDSILVDFIRLPGETHYGKKRVLEKAILWFYHRDPRRRGRLDGIGK